MNARAKWLALAVIIATLTLPDAVAAQQGWTWNITAEAGPVLPTRDLGKNVGELQQVVARQVSAKMQPALSLGGGIEAVTPDGRTVVRGVVRRTLGGESSARVALCEVLDGELCNPRSAEATMTSFHGELVFVQGEASDRFRQNFVLGIGVRSYQFTTDACDPDESDNEGVYVICGMVQEIYEDQSQVQPFIQFGFGFSFDQGPATLHIRVNDVVGRYSGGSGNADGDFQNDLYVSAGLSFPVR